MVTMSREESEFGQKVLSIRDPEDGGKVYIAPVEIWSSVVRTIRSGSLSAEVQPIELASAASAVSRDLTERNAGESIAVSPVGVREALLGAAALTGAFRVADEAFWWDPEEYARFDARADALLEE